MKISILLPFHNSAPWITETIQSIQNQSYENWELIALDDFSTDNSYSILTNFAANDFRIKLHKNMQKGIIPALQLGLTHAQGTFLSRMDADDLMPENRLKLMVNHLNSLPEKSIVTGKVTYFSDTNVSEGYRIYEDWLNERIKLNDHFDHIYRECVVASPNWLARTGEIRDAKIFSELNYPEDYDMTFRWLQQGFSIHGIDETTLLWREHPARTSRNSDVYDQESFFSLKLDRFCALHPTDSLAILGAGTKGKLTADFLLQRNVDFRWYDLNWQNYKAPVYGKTILNFEELEAQHVLIAIYPKDRKPLLAYLHEKGFEIGKNAWFL